MATSGSTNFNLTRNDAIQEALELIGVLAAGETAPAADITSAARSLNMMLKTWQADGLHLWRQTEGSLTLVSGTQSYTMAAGGDFTVRPLRILSARLRISSVDTPLMEMSRQEYFDLPLKSTSGRPTGYYYDPGRVTGRLYVWPTLASGSSGTIEFTYARALEDMDAAGDDFDLPQEWFEAIAYNLAVRIAPKFGGPAGPDIVALAAMFKANLDGWDREGSIYMQPEVR